MTPRSPAYLVAASGVRGALLPALGCGVLGVAVATLQGAGARNGALAAVVGVYGFLLSGIPVELLAISLDRLKGFTVLALGYLARVVEIGRAHV